MLSVKYAEYEGDEYVSTAGDRRPRYIKNRIFSEEEILPAEKIVAAMEGMTIESAERILEKVKLCLKQVTVPKMEN